MAEPAAQDQGEKETSEEGIGSVAKKRAGLGFLFFFSQRCTVACLVACRRGYREGSPLMRS